MRTQLCATDCFSLSLSLIHQVSFAGTTIKVAEMELVAAGLPTSRIQEVYGAFLVSLDLSRCMISSRGAEVLGAAIIANDTLRKVCLLSLACLPPHRALLLPPLPLAHSVVLADRYG